ncbi:FAD-dependent oxidoreductase [Actinophytocola sp.]|uniref:NAD(P)/FAD-dependent oxidoreductase n=1 Tax=Actinophytocola sp. TaxID=1872138 RepID=UPI002D806566|nr:FAD-dependent oxidoreductase [Actinophytocola sp.]HET9137743.1 FAD-dependent oxidoreductase [Actinophytocola sp.]
MRIAIVGGGVIALLSAVNCVSAGHDVVLVDQADIPFSGATSFDRHRVIHALHPDPVVAAAAMRAHLRWIDLQDRLSTRFYEQIGALTAVADRELPDTMAMLAGVGAPASILPPDELTARFPHVVFPPGTSGVLEPHTGVLLADRVLAACVGWLRWSARARLHPHRRAVWIDTDNATVQLAGGELVRADAVLLAVGPWSRALLPPDLAGELVLHRQSMIYCDVPPSDARRWSATPVLRALGPTGGGWLVPPVATAPLKLSDPSAGRVVSEVGDNTTPPHWRDRLLGSFAEVVPALRAEWLIDTRDCYYLTRAATGGSMLAVLGERVVSYAACGGASFKFAPLIAECLVGHLTGADLEPTGLDPLDHPTVWVAPDIPTGHRQARSVSEVLP